MKGRVASRLTIGRGGDSERLPCVIGGGLAKVPCSESILAGMRLASRVLSMSSQGFPISYDPSTSTPRRFGSQQPSSSPAVRCLCCRDNHCRREQRTRTLTRPRLPSELCSDLPPGSPPPAPENPIHRANRLHLSVLWIFSVNCGTSLSHHGNGLTQNGEQATPSSPGGGLAGGLGSVSLLSPAVPCRMNRDGNVCVNSP